MMVIQKDLLVSAIISPIRCSRTSLLKPTRWQVTEHLDCNTLDSMWHVVYEADFAALYQIKCFIKVSVKRKFILLSKWMVYLIVNNSSVRVSFFPFLKLIWPWRFQSTPPMDRTKSTPTVLHYTSHYRRKDLSVFQFLCNFKEKCLYLPLGPNSPPTTCHERILSTIQ